MGSADDFGIRNSLRVDVSAPNGLALLFTAATMGPAFRDPDQETLVDHSTGLERAALGTWRDPALRIALAASINWG